MVSTVASEIDETRSRIGRGILLGLLLAAVTAVYANSLGVPFLLDDITTILANRSIQTLSPVAAVLFPPPDVYSAGRPVLNLTFALNYTLGGTVVGGYHAVNLAIHLAATMVLFGVLRRTLLLPKLSEAFAPAATPLAFIIAGLWGLHPLNTVSVVYVSQRAESLMGLFYLLTIYFFIRSVPAGALHWRIVSIGACIFALATKEVAVTAPVLVFLLDATCVSGSFREAWRLRWRYHVALASTWLVLAALMLNSELGRRAVGAEHGITWFDYARLECSAVAHYLRLALWPVPLVFDYGANLPLPTWTSLILPAAVLCAIAVIAVQQLRRCQPLGFLAGSFFLLLAPTSSIVPIAGQPIAENRMYLPLVSVMAVLAAGAYRSGTRQSYFAMATGIVALGWLAHVRNADFRSAVDIWRDTTAKQPINERAWVYLSEALKAEGRMGEAIEAMLAGVRHRPASAELANNAAVNLFAVGRTTEAILHFKTAIRLKPDYAEAYYNLGIVYFRSKNFAAASNCFERQLQLKPGSAEAHNYLGLCFFNLGNLEAAAPQFERAVELDPNHRDAKTNLEGVKARRR
jgi:tetratricopeptide (TPR) repeat protein